MDQREPIELPVEHILNTPPRETARPFVFQVQFGNWKQPPHEPPLRFHARRPRRVLPLLLFVATCLSTFFTGGQMFGLEVLPGTPPQAVFDFPKFLAGGLQYSTALMAILVAHEMGHFLQARRYGVPASWLRLGHRSSLSHWLHKLVSPRAGLSGCRDVLFGDGPDVPTVVGCGASDFVSTRMFAITPQPLREVPADFGERSSSESLP